MADSPPLTAPRTGSSAAVRRRALRCVQTTTGLQGLMSESERKAERKLRTACKAAKTYEDAAEKSMAAMTRIYGHNRRSLVHRHVSELKFVELAEGLARNLTALRTRVSRLSLRLEELSGNVQKQMEDVYRTEVDVDLNLRACSGSCRSVLPFGVDHLGYWTPGPEVEQVEQVERTLSQRRKAAPPPGDVPRVKLQPVDAGPPPPAGYRSIPAVRRELLTQFEDIGQNQVVVEELMEELMEVLHPGS